MTKESKYFRAFKCWDPEVFDGKSKDPVVAKLWLSSVDKVLSTHKVSERTGIELHHLPAMQ